MIALVSHIAFTGALNGGTTSGIDTTGASLLVVSIASADNTTPPITDSNGNSWSLAFHARQGNCDNTIYYVSAPIVGVGHTFTVTGTLIVSAFCVAAFSGTQLSSPLEASTNAHASDASATALPGTITLTGVNDLLISGVACNSTVSGPTVSGTGYASTDTVLCVGANNYGVGLAYATQAGGGTSGNPTWTQGTASAIVTTQIGFLALGDGVAPYLVNWS